MKATALIFARGDSKGLPRKNMVKTHADGTVGLVIPPQSAIVRRRDAPTVFDMATVTYGARPEFGMPHNATFEVVGAGGPCINGACD